MDAILKPDIFPIDVVWVPLGSQGSPPTKSSHEIVILNSLDRLLTCDRYFSSVAATKKHNY